MRYTDGNIETFNTTKKPFTMQSVSREYIDQKFTLTLLNRDAALITVYYTPMSRPEQTWEVPPSTPGIVLDNLGYENFVNGLYAKTDAGTARLAWKLYSMDITVLTKEQERSTNIAAQYPRDTYRYPHG